MKYFRILIVLLLLTVTAVPVLGAEMKPVEATVYSSDKLPIRYEYMGEGEPALVFIHCWCCDRTYWKKQFPYFAQKNKCVVLDLGGHGESGVTRKDWTLEGFAKDVIAVIDRLELKKVILIGHSMGGPVAVKIATLIPDKVLGVIGVDTIGNVEQKWAKEQFDQFIGGMTANFPQFTEGFVRGMMFQPDADPKLVDWIAKNMSEGPAEVGIGAMESMYKLDLAAMVETIKVPVYVVNADKFPINEEINKRHIANFKARILPGTGHFLHMEKPVEFNKLLEATINDIISFKK